MKTLIVVKPGWKRYPGLLFGIGVFAHGNGMAIILHHTATASKAFWEQFFPDNAKMADSERTTEYLISASSIFIIIEGDNAVELVKQRVVKTRKIYGKKDADIKNVLHSSDSEESAQKEIGLVIEFMSQDRL